MRALFAFLLGLLLTVSAAPAQHLSPLAPPPVWSSLDPFQETIAHDDFLKLLHDVYAPAEAAKGVIEVGPDAATIQTGTPAAYTLRFAVAGQEKPAPRFWRTAAALEPALPAKPLAGVKIALDAGHLGGPWARMEERFLQVGESKPVTEGDLTLRVATLLKPRLEALGAVVTLVRASTDPVTAQRPADLRAAARADLAQQGHPAPHETYRDFDDPRRGGSVQFQSELLFYRTSEIRARATLVNTRLQPDLTICLHLNAEAWGDPQHPAFVPHNHLHVLLNGCYSAAELKHDDVRLDMLLKLLSRCYPEERATAEAVAASLAKATGLPPYTYTTGNALPIGDTGYLWARNLLANRLYQTPVIFLEPYVMNSELIWERVQAGDYEGEIELGGVRRKSLFREYADAVAEGLRDYYTQARPKK